MRDKDPQLIPAGQTVVLDGSVTINGFTPEKSVILVHPSLSSLPSGLLVKTCLVDLPTKAPYKVPVVLTNETRLNDVTLCLIVRSKNIQQRSVTNQIRGQASPPPLLFRLLSGVTCRVYSKSRTGPANSREEFGSGCYDSNRMLTVRTSRFSQELRAR